MMGKWSSIYLAPAALSHATSLSRISLYLLILVLNSSLWSTGMVHSHISSVGTGPPQHGNQHFAAGGALLDKSSSIFFIACSLAASPAASTAAAALSFIPLSMLAIASKNT